MFAALNLAPHIVETYRGVGTVYEEQLPKHHTPTSTPTARKSRVTARACVYWLRVRDSFQGVGEVVDYADSFGYFSALLCSCQTQRSPG